MVFANIEYLFLLLLLIPYIIWYIMKRKNSEATLQISDARVYAHTPKSYKNYLLHVPFALRIIALALVILILARPQTTNSWQNSEIEGIDIMLAIDVSTSMLAEDLKPNRLEAAKDVAAEFINGRPNDNIGITLFAGESFTQCPLTVDHAVLLNLIKDVKCGLIEDGTAVGMGIANAVTRLKDSKAKSKVIILLTDGTNNKGDISPLTAAEIAKSFGIRVYTIGVGTNGMAPYPYPVGGTVQYVNMPVEIDEKTLTQIAGTTDGNYFRATSNSKLKEVYEKAYGELKYNKQELLQDAIVSFDNACVGYDFYDYVFRNYDWSKGIPSSEDINLAFVDGYDKNYIVPIYSKNCKLIAYMYYEPQRNFMYGIRFVENSFGDEVDYCSVLPMHMKAHYVYSAVKEAQLGRIHNMILFTESSNYQYCVVDTDKGSYAYDFPYKTGYGVWVDNRAQVGILYTNIKGCDKKCLILIKIIYITHQIN